MAVVDTSMYLQQQAPDIAGGIEKGLKLREMISEQNEKGRLRSQAEAEKGLYSVGADGKVALDTGDKMKDFATKYGSRAHEIQLAATQQDLAMQKAAAEAKHQKFIQAKEMTDQVTNVLGGVHDDSSFQSAMKQLRGMGIPEEKLTDKFDPQWVKDHVGIGLDMKTRLDKEHHAHELFVKGFREGPGGEIEMIPGGVAATAQRKATAEAGASESDLANAPLKKQKLVAEIGEINAKASKEKAASDPKLKEYKKEQYDAGGFAKRIEQAEQIFGSLQDNGYNRATAGQDMEGKLWPILQNESLRKQDQAERNFINAVLRRESGAAISPEEFASAQQQYFPRGGDTPDVVANKKANRLQSLASIKAAAGGAYEQIPTVGSGGFKMPSTSDIDAELAKRSK